MQDYLVPYRSLDVEGSPVKSIVQVSAENWDQAKVVAEAQLKDMEMTVPHVGQHPGDNEREIALCMLRATQSTGKDRLFWKTQAAFFRGEGPPALEVFARGRP